MNINYKLLIKIFKKLYNLFQARVAISLTGSPLNDQRMRWGKAFTSWSMNLEASIECRKLSATAFVLVEYSPKTGCKRLTPALIKQNVLEISWRALCVLTSSSHRSIMFKMLAVIWCHCYLTLPFPSFSAVRNPEYLNLSGQSSALIFLIWPWVRTAA